MFIIKTKYIKSEDEINKFRDEHIRYFKNLANQNKILGGGRLVDGTGAIIVVLISDQKELNEIIANDPYVLNGLITHEVINFNLKGLMADHLIDYLKLK